MYLHLTPRISLPVRIVERKICLRLLLNICGFFLFLFFFLELFGGIFLTAFFLFLGAHLQNGALYISSPVDSEGVHSNLFFCLFFFFFFSFFLSV